MGQNGMKYTCKYCGEGVTGWVITYDDSWILVDEKPKKWVTMLNGEMHKVKDGYEKNK